MASKGGGSAYARNGLAVIGNAQNSNKLPIGQGHGSVFILAQNLTMNTNTRIGSGYSGDGVTGYRGINTRYAITANGSGANGGVAQTAGGYGGNGGYYSGYVNEIRTKQGAHIMIIADRITGFCVHAIGTGGGSYNMAGYGCMGWTNPSWLYPGYNGGGGGYDSRYAGGSSGWAFVYCNSATSQNVTGTTLTL